MSKAPAEMDKLLKQVSRSFYLTLRILPRSIRKQISLAYMLARASDTVADTRLIAPARRREALAQLRGAIGQACAGKLPVTPDFGDLADAQGTVAGEGNPGERALLEHLEELLRECSNIAREDSLRIGKLLDIITAGQETDIVRFDVASAGLAALETDAELDEYTYSVAGCVGEFWTEMCRAHVFPAAPLDEALLRQDGVRFGKGLQLVNILRDLPGDLRKGRCYIPATVLAGFGLKPQDLLDPLAMGQFRPALDRYLDEAADHLGAGWRYTVSLPFRCARIRLACAWPVLIGIRTLMQLRAGNVLDPAYRIKVGRSEIREIIGRSIFLYPYPAAWARLSGSVPGAAQSTVGQLDRDKSAED